jgi:hypothetical protein
VRRAEEMEMWKGCEGNMKKGGKGTKWIKQR